MTTSHESKVRLYVWKMNRPRGRSTRAASPITRCGSSTCSRKSIAQTTSKLSSANERRRASPTRYRTDRVRSRRAATAMLLSDTSMPVTFQPRAASGFERKPAPQPRSRMRTLRRSPKARAIVSITQGVQCAASARRSAMGSSCASYQRSPSVSQTALFTGAYFVCAMVVVCMAGAQGRSC
jgi:hypothetical protein